MTEAVHPSVFIQEEMDARGWDRAILAQKMGGDVGLNALALDFYLEIGAEEPALRIGDVSARQLGEAFGVSPEFFLNLEAAWLRAVEPGRG